MLWLSNLSAVEAAADCRAEEGAHNLRADRSPSADLLLVLPVIPAVVEVDPLADPLDVEAAGSCCYLFFDDGRNGNRNQLG